VYSIFMLLLFVVMWRVRSKQRQCW